MAKTCKQRHRARRKSQRGVHKRVGLDPDSYVIIERVMFILNYCRNQARNGNKRAAITLILVESYLYTGLRAIELLGLQLQDLPQFNRTHNILRVPAEFAKGNKQRILKVHSNIIKKWTEYIERFHRPALKLIASGDRVKKEAGLSAPLILNEWGKPMRYSSVYGRIKTVGRHTGINLYPHKLRHTYATLFMQFAPIDQVQKQLGHSSRMTTEIYAETIQTELDKNVEKLNIG